MLSTAISVNGLQIYRTSYTVRSAITATVELFVNFILPYKFWSSQSDAMLTWDEVDNHHLSC